MKPSELVTDPKFVEKDLSGRMEVLNEYWDSVKLKTNNDPQYATMGELHKRGYEAAYRAQNSPKSAVRDFHEANAEALSLTYSRIKKGGLRSKEGVQALQDYGKFMEEFPTRFEDQLQEDKLRSEAARNILELRRQRFKPGVGEVIARVASGVSGGERDTDLAAEEEEYLGFLRESLGKTQKAFTEDDVENIIEKEKLSLGDFEEPFQVGDDGALHFSPNALFLSKEEAVKQAKESGAARMDIEDFIASYDERRKALGDKTLKKLERAGWRKEIEKFEGETDQDKAIALLNKYRKEGLFKSAGKSLGSRGQDILARVMPDIGDLEEKPAARRDFLEFVQQFSENKYSYSLLADLGSAVGGTLPDLAMFGIGAGFAGGVMKGGKFAAMGEKARQTIQMAAGASIPSGMSAAETFEQARAMGADLKTAASGAFLSFLTEFGPTLVFRRSGSEGLFVAGIERQAIEGGLRKAKAEFAKKVGKNIGLELAEEELSTISELLLVQMQMDPTMTMKEGFDAVRSAALAAGALGGLGAFGEFRQVKDLQEAGMAETAAAVLEKMRDEEVSPEQAEDLSEAELSPENAPEAVAGTSPTEPATTPQEANTGQEQAVPTRPSPFSSPSKQQTATEKTAQVAPASPEVQSQLEQAAYEQSTEWDIANRSNRSSEWFDGAKANEDARRGYQEAMENGGDSLQAHGMAKESTLSGAIKNLSNLLRNGLDPNRRGGRLDTAPLVSKPGEGLVGATASGSAYADGPFTLVAKPGQNLEGDLSGLGAVVINQANAAQAEAIKKAIQAIRPDIFVGTASELGAITRSLISGTGKKPLPGQQFATEQTAPVEATQAQEQEDTLEGFVNQLENEAQTPTQEQEAGPVPDVEGEPAVQAPEVETEEGTTLREGQDEGEVETEEAAPVIEAQNPPTPTRASQEREAILTLPEDDQLPVAMISQGRTVQEVATATGKTVDEVRDTVERAATTTDGLARVQGLLMLDPNGVTSTMNAVMRAERATRGAPSILRGAMQSHPELMAMAENRMQNDPDYAEKLVNEAALGQGKIDEVDQAVLLFEKVRMMNARREAYRKAGDPLRSKEDRKEAQDHMESLDAKLNKIDHATFYTGQVWGRLGRFRQSLMRDDFSIEEMTRRARAAKGGKELTTEEISAIQEMSENLQATVEKREQIEAAQEARERIDALEKALEEMKASQPENINPKIIEIAEKIANRIHAAADKAEERLKQKLGRTNLPLLGGDPTILVDLAIIGASKIARGIEDFTAWSAAMIEQTKAYIKKEDLEPYLEELHEESKKTHERQLETVPKRSRGKVKKIITDEDRAKSVERSKATIRKKVEEEPDIDLNRLRPIVQNMALNHVRMGVTDRETLVDIIHADLQAVLPDITRQQTMDIISGYGDYAKLDKEPAKKIFRAMKGEMQQLGKKADLLAGRPPKRSGVERREKGDEERRIEKEVNELKRRVTFEESEDTLRTATSAIKKRLENQIDDMDYAMARGEPMPKRSKKTYDEEIQALQARRDEKRKDYDKMFPKEPPTEAEQLAEALRIADKNIEQLKDDIANNRLYPHHEKNTITSPELEAKKAELEDLRAQRDLLRRLDTETVERKKEADLEKKIAKAQEATDAKQKKELEYTVKSARVTELEEELEQIRNDKKNSPEERAKRAHAAIDRTIANLEEQIATGIVPGRKESEPVTGAELEAKREYVKALRVERDKILALDAVRDEKTKIKRLESALERAKNPPTPRMPKQGPDSEEVARMKEELRQIREDRRNDPERILAVYKARRASTMANMADRIARGDVLPKKRKPIEKDEEARRLDREYANLQRDFYKMQHEMMLKQRDLGQKAFQESVHVLTTARAVMTSGDLSAAGRQGILLGASHPKVAAEAFKKQIQALKSQEAYEDMNRELIDESENSEIYKEAKLFLVHPHEYSLKKMEEAYMSRLIDKAAEKDLAGPLAPIIAAAKVVNKSQNAYITYLNFLRAKTFDVLIEEFRGPDGKIDPDDARVVAKYINSATGRSAYMLKESSAALNAALFAPRLVASRIEMALGFPLVDAVVKDLKKGRNPFDAGSLSRVVGFEAARTGAVLTSVATLAMLAGAEWEDDVTSAGFSKLKIGNSYIDFLGGLAQVIVLTNRTLIRGETTSLITGEKRKLRGPEKPYGSDNAFDVFTRFFRSKLSPVFGAAANVITGEDVVGNLSSVEGELKKMFTPLVVQDVVEGFKEYDIPKATALGFLAFLGIGVQTLNPERAMEERKAQRQLLKEKGDQYIDIFDLRP